MFVYPTNRARIICFLLRVEDKRTASSPGRVRMILADGVGGKEVKKLLRRGRTTEKEENRGEKRRGGRATERTLPR